MLKKNLAKSKKKRLELLMDCKRTLQVLLDDWKETPSLDEDKIMGKIRESWMKERNMLTMKVKIDSTTVGNTCLTVENVTKAEKIVNMTANNVRDDYTSDSDSTDDAKKKKEQENDFEEKSEVKNKSSHTQSSDSTGQTKSFLKAKTTIGSPVRQLKLKKAINIIPARVSRQIDENFITKPRQIYRSMEISDQTSSSTDTN